MIVHTMDQGSTEWLAVRVGRATASNFGSILATIKSGEAAVRRNYRARLVVERLTGLPVSTFETAAMRQGVEREPLARDAYMVRTGNLVQQIGFIQHDTIDCGGSPDGLIDDDGCLEIKSPELAAHLEYLRLQGPPSEYVPQIQGCMWLSERSYCDFVSFNPDFPPHLQLVVRRVLRDEKYIAGLALAVELFMSEVREEEAAVRALPVAA